MRKYELTVIVKPDVDAANLAALQEKIKGILAVDGGTIARTEMWGMRRLGYPIKKAREGQYVHLLVELEPSTVVRIENRVKLLDDVLRHLLVVAENVRPEPAAAPAPAPEATVAAPEPAAAPAGEA